jgi:hypothetical protein
VKGIDPDSDRVILWEVSKNSTAKPARQILIVDQNGEIDWVRLGRFGTPVSALKTLLETKRDNGWRPQRFYGDSTEDLQEIRQLCTDVFGDKHVQLFSNEPGIIVSARSVFSVSQAYLRAIAKIGFHSFLHFFPNFTGFEPTFDDIKRFIYHGTGGPNPFVWGQQGPILPGLEAYGAPVHVVACEWEQGFLHTRLQFFVGLKTGMRLKAGSAGGASIETEPGRFVWVVRLGRNPSRLVYEARTGALLRYFSKIEDGYHGQLNLLPLGSKILPIARLLYGR